MSDVLEEEQRVLHDLEHSVNNNKKEFQHQYLGESFGKGDGKKEQTKEMFKNMNDIDRIMALFMGCCGLGEVIFGDGRL